MCIASLLQKEVEPIQFFRVCQLLVLYCHYPRKRNVPDNLREGVVPGTLFSHSENSWINSDIYLKWFEFLIKSIPPTRPVLLIQDGHASHMSIKLIDLVHSNDIHLLCLPAHTTHILQPLDVHISLSILVVSLLMT